MRARVERLANPKVPDLIDRVSTDWSNCLHKVQACTGESPDASQVILAYTQAKAVMPGPVTLTADNIELDEAWNLVERALQLEMFPRLHIHYTCYTPVTRFYLTVAPPLETLLATRVHLQVAAVPEAELPNQFTVPCGKTACCCGAFTLLTNAVARPRLCLAVQVSLAYGVDPKPSPPENWWPEGVRYTRPARSSGFPRLVDEEADVQRVKEGSMRD